MASYRRCQMTKRRKGNSQHFTGEVMKVFVDRKLSRVEDEGINNKIKFSGINSAAWEIRSRMFLLIENYAESKTREIFYQQKHE
ncbi:hypothetical protein NQ317_009344 [Molorchus minor]|uniref:Uncharacterized protein n=1 Tax=Molorchus minor TaxID=1323400 RepID=A0ABQ9JQY3_9CUCU|nr:hypothetical protein NQ317_009344 [Molorchus minor]